MVDSQDQNSQITLGCWKLVPIGESSSQISSISTNEQSSGSTKVEATSTRANFVQNVLCRDEWLIILSHLPLDILVREAIWTCTMFSDIILNDQMFISTILNNFLKYIPKHLKVAYSDAQEEKPHELSSAFLVDKRLNFDLYILYCYYRIAKTDPALERNWIGKLRDLGYQVGTAFPLIVYSTKETILKQVGIPTKMFACFRISKLCFGTGFKNLRTNQNGKYVMNVESKAWNLLHSKICQGELDTIISKLYIPFLNQLFYGILTTVGCVVEDVDMKYLNILEEQQDSISFSVQMAVV